MSTRANSSLYLRTERRRDQHALRAKKKKVRGPLVQVPKVLDPELPGEHQAMDRRVADGAVVSTSFDVHMPQRGAGVFHLALASLPVSTIVSLKLRVGDQSPLR